MRHRDSQGGIYCTYDAFTRTDLRCELSVPGGVTTYAIDGEGNQVRQTEPEEPLEAPRSSAPPPA